MQQNTKKKKDEGVLSRKVAQIGYKGYEKVRSAKSHEEIVNSGGGGDLTPGLTVHAGGPIKSKRIVKQ